MTTGTYYSDPHMQRADLLIRLQSLADSYLSGWEEEKESLKRDMWRAVNETVQLDPIN